MYLLDFCGLFAYKYIFFLCAECASDCGADINGKCKPYFTKNVEHRMEQMATIRRKVWVIWRNFPADVFHIVFNWFCDMRAERCRDGKLLPRV